MPATEPAVMIRPVRPLIVAALALLYLGCGAGGSGPSGPGDDEPNTGSVRVEVTTGGEDVDPDGYQLVLEDGSRSTHVAVNSSATLSDVPPGQYTILLGGVAVNCPVSGGTDRDVSVSAGGESTVSFEITCEPAAGIVFVWARDDDPGIYSAKVNGADVELVAADAWGLADPNTVAEIVPSPDGEWIAFLSDREGGEEEWELYRIRPDGSDLRQITDEDLFLYRDPSWSADGDMLLTVTFTGTVIAARSGGEIVSRVLGSASEPVIGAAWR